MAPTMRCTTEEQVNSLRVGGLHPLNMLIQVSHRSDQHDLFFRVTGLRAWACHHSGIPTSPWRKTASTIRTTRAPTLTILPCTPNRQSRRTTTLPPTEATIAGLALSMTVTLGTAKRTHSQELTRYSPSFRDIRSNRMTFTTRPITCVLLLILKLIMDIMRFTEGHNLLVATHQTPVAREGEATFQSP